MTTISSTSTKPITSNVSITERPSVELKGTRSLGLNEILFVEWKYACEPNKVLKYHAIALQYHDMMRKILNTYKHMGESIQIVEQ